MEPLALRCVQPVMGGSQGLVSLGPGWDCCVTQRQRARCHLGKLLRLFGPQSSDLENGVLK